ncbi:MAG: hypothetical protein AB4063_16695 [Crocosphaera sp.]
MIIYNQTTGVKYGGEVNHLDYQIGDNAIVLAGGSRQGIKLEKTDPQSPLISQTLPVEEENSNEIINDSPALMRFLLMLKSKLFCLYNKELEAANIDGTS